MKLLAALVLPALSLAVATASGIDGDLMHYLSKSSFGRERAIDMFVQEFTSEASAGGRRRRLDKALEAMKFAETDNEPVPVEGHDFLFVGSVGEPTGHFIFCSH